MASAEFDLNQLLGPLVAGNGEGVEAQFSNGETASHTNLIVSTPAQVVQDPVVQTAEDRPAKDTLPALVDPAADHEEAEVKERRLDVDAKHERILQFLDEHDYDGLLLTRADALAWFSSGGDFGIDYATQEGAAWILINRKCRSLIADNVQSPRLFEEEVAGLGFQLKERPWIEDPREILLSLVGSKKIATDAYLPGLINVSRDLKKLRGPLSGIERRRLRQLGRTLTLAVEATCRNFQPGEKEADIAGHLAHRLLREGVAPVSIRVASDDRLDRFRQPTFKAAPINKRATITAVGRRFGLCAAVTRTISFGPVDAMVRTEHTLATMVDATCIYFSRPNEPISEVFRRARRIYEKFDCPHEWTLDYQGCQIGYSPREQVFLPDSPELLTNGMAVAWSPSVGSARSEDTVLVDDRGFEVVTEAQDWPKLEVIIKGYSLPRPGILER